MATSPNENGNPFAALAVGAFTNSMMLPWLHTKRKRKEYTRRKTDLSLTKQIEDLLLQQQKKKLKEASSSASSSGKDGAPLTPEQVERNIQEALACPCIADFRDGPCGPSFVAAFSCFLRSTSSQQASAGSSGGGGDGANAPECLGAFEAMQACMVKHPEAFTDFVKSKEEAEADEDAEDSGGDDKKK